MSDLRYQTLQVPRGFSAPGGPSARGNAVGAGVKLLHKAMKALNGWAVSWRVNKELEEKRPQIEAAIGRVEERLQQSRPDAGVLVVVGLQEWAIPDPTGTRAQSFLSLHLAGSGIQPDKVLRDYVSRPQLVQGAAKGWRRKEVFIWATRARL